MKHNKSIAIGFITLIIICMIVTTLIYYNYNYSYSSLTQEYFSNEFNTSTNAPIIFIDERLFVKPSNIKDAGYGVFTKSNIEKGEIIERCHGLTIKTEDRRGIITSYDFTLNSGDTFLCFGYGSLYNHSNTPNVQHEMDSTQSTMQYRTTRPISAGEELYVSYGENWFKNRGIEIL